MVGFGIFFAAYDSITRASLLRIRSQEWSTPNKQWFAEVMSVAAAGGVSGVAYQAFSYPVHRLKYIMYHSEVWAVLGFVPRVPCMVNVHCKERACGWLQRIFALRTHTSCILCAMQGASHAHALACLRALHRQGAIALLFQGMGVRILSGRGGKCGYCYIQAASCALVLQI